MTKDSARKWWGTAGLWIAVALAITAKSSVAGKSKQPNIIILFADDMGYGDLPLTGHPTTSAPNLQKMAEEGMVLTQFYSANTICSPSRCARLHVLERLSGAFCTDVSKPNGCMHYLIRVLQHLTFLCDIAYK